MNTKNWFPTVLGAGIIASGLALTSCEDDFTEADAIAAQDSTLIALKRLENENAVAENELDAQQELAFQKYQDSLSAIGPVVSYSVNVVAGGSSSSNARMASENNAEGATVTLIQGGVERTATANANGVAFFNDLRVGQAIVTVTAEDHTTVTYTTSLGEAGSGLNEDNVTTVIPILPLTVEAGASEISGTIYAELDLTTEEPEFAEGAVIRATMDVDAIANGYSTDFNNTLKGGIQSASYSDLIQTATVGADGKYSIVVPNGNGKSGEGIGTKIEMLPYEATQTYVTWRGDSLATVTRNVVFSPFSDSDDIYDEIEDDLDLPSMYLEVGAPTGEATGFALEAEVQPSTLQRSILEIDARGSGYKGPREEVQEGNNNELQAVGNMVYDEIYFVADNDDRAAYIRVDAVDDNGAITEYTLFENGAEYTSKPGFASEQNMTDGTGATFELGFVAEYDIKIASEGTGYWDLPELRIEYSDEEDGSLTDGVYFFDDEENDLEIDLALRNGKVSDDEGSITDNKIASIWSAKKPTFTIINPEAKQAIIPIEELTIEEDGSLSFDSDNELSLSSEDGGAGYLDAPSVMVKSFGEGMGSGATVAATVSDGKITSLTFTNSGKGYRPEANVFSDVEVTEDQMVQTDDSGNSLIQPGTKITNFNTVIGKYNPS